MVTEIISAASGLLSFVTIIYVVRMSNKFRDATATYREDLQAIANENDKLYEANRALKAFSEDLDKANVKLEADLAVERAANAFVRAQRDELLKVISENGSAKQVADRINKTLQSLAGREKTP